jgi:uncharacterized protein with PQ loop repeat
MVNNNPPVPRSHLGGSKRVISFLAYVTGILGPLLTLPQAYLIWANKSAENVSLISWLTYVIMAVVWLVYGIQHKDKPIIGSNILWLVVHSSILIGIILFR